MTTDPDREKLVRAVWSAKQRVMSLYMDYGNRFKVTRGLLRAEAALAAHDAKHKQDAGGNHAEA